MLDNLTDIATLPNDRARGFRRHTIGLFSEYIHPRRFLNPGVELTLLATDSATLLTLWRAMELCRDKGLLPRQANTRALEVMEECERLQSSVDE